MFEIKKLITIQFLAQNKTNYFLTLPIMLFGLTLRTLKLTVLAKGLHSPMVTMSPSLTLKQGEQ
jgi:hypothetical protein